MRRVSQSAAARRDLVEHFVYLAETAGLEAADRFLSQARASFGLLAQQPDIGSPLHLRQSELAGLRKWRVTGFDNHLIFYLPRPDGIRVVRVLHAASDWWALLGLAN